MTAHSVVELPGIETEYLPGALLAFLRVCSVSFLLSPARYLQFPFWLLTASTALCSHAPRVAGWFSDRSAAGGHQPCAGSCQGAYHLPGMSSG